MSIILDIKDAIRKAVYNRDNTINFNFNHIKVAKYPFVFLYIPSFQLEKAIDTEYWRKLTLNCVIEYSKYEENEPSVLWAYADTLSEALKNFEFKDTKLQVQRPEFKTVDEVLQMTFNLELYVKDIDDTELMEELDITLK